MTAICKRDLKALFFSRTGILYLVGSLFVLNLGFVFFCLVRADAHMDGIFSILPFVLMFGIPLLTARAFALDFERGTDKLWLTSPRRLSGIVIGKFLSLFILFLILLLPTLLWQPVTVLLGGGINGTFLLGRYAGLICMGAAYIAIGLFFSSASKNPRTAAASCLAFFSTVCLFEVLTTGSGLPDLLMNAVPFISVRLRFAHIVSGYFSPTDFLYMLSVCFLFLFLNVQNLEKRLWA